MSSALKIGVLGAARIAPSAILKPARRNARAEVLAVAARDGERAERLARRFGIERHYSSYQDLLDDEDIDAIYNPLPNGLHGAWTVAALNAGKHVLCEKPFAANADEAQQVCDLAEVLGLKVMEAFHWRYHAVTARALAVIASGEIGQVEHVESNMCFPLPMFKDIRWQLALAGGAMMDGGCYAVSMARCFAGDEQGMPEVLAATAMEKTPGVDRYTEAQLRFGNGVTARLRTSMWSRVLFDMSVRVQGSEGELKILNPILPQAFHRLTVVSKKGRRREQLSGPSSYAAQLQAFVDHVRLGNSIITGPEYACRNMQIIDAIYRAAGLEPRSPS